MTSHPTSFWTTAIRPPVYGATAADPVSVSYSAYHRLALAWAAASLFLLIARCWVCGHHTVAGNLVPPNRLQGRAFSRFFAPSASRFVPLQAGRHGLTPRRPKRPRPQVVARPVRVWTLGPQDVRPTLSTFPGPDVLAEVGRKPITATLPGLTAEERRLFDLLMEVDEQYLLRAELRVVGGWVRDKLLGRQPRDIDITVLGPPPPLLKRFTDVPYLTGADFFSYVQKWLRETNSSRPGFAYLVPGETNPRRLSVAVGKVCGFDVAMTNLWTSSTVSPSTSLYEDALRRDLTINALFYNLHTGLVEDWTRQGLADLDKRLIRTPMAPQLTFDAFPMAPARPLRCIRFACRLNFTLAPDIIAAAQTEKARNDLASRVTRKRLGCELEEMVTCPDPYRALWLLGACGFREIVFQIHPPANRTLLNLSLLRPVAWDPTPAAPASWEVALAALRRCAEGAVYRDADTLHRGAITFAALFRALAPEVDTRLAAVQQFTAVRSWYRQVASYPFAINARTAGAAAKLTLAARRLPSVLAVAAIDPASDPQQYLQLANEFEAWLCFVTGLVFEVVLHFYDCTRDPSQPSSAPMRTYAARLEAVRVLYTQEQLAGLMVAAHLPHSVACRVQRAARRLRHHQLAFPNASADWVLSTTIQSLYTERDLDPDDPTER